MERVAALGRRVLPRGWRDFAIQLVIWFGFYFSYLGVRHLTYATPGKALGNGVRVISLEQHVTHHLFELSVERVADSSSFLLTAAAWTYWNSEFTVIGLTLLWVYLRRHERFRRFRNTILLANLIGLVGFALMPTAPPWMFPGQGILDGALARAGGKSTPFGAFMDSTTDRVGEGAMLAAIALVFAHHGRDWAVVPA